MNLPFITIVSGLPRSGTSMMMQAIEAGGIPALTDNIRKKDEDNPEGYYEFEPVKKTKDDPSWVPGARGKVVKMVYALLYDLPEEYEYRVIFMRRNMDEVLASQKIMLERSDKKGATISDEKLAKLFEAQLDKFDHWIAARKNFPVLSVNYKDMITSPKAQCERINKFLGGVLDSDASAAVVDPSLYRNKT
ncbi:MAG: sulfotransferase domain-containing protein [Deltaproteobacteria bacterium]|nr:sulfotransferase domain-containing protein [Deltaproteobacteria bacterium]